MSHTTIEVRSNALTTSNVIIADIGFIIPLGGGSFAYTDDADILRLITSSDLLTLTTDNAFPAAAPGNTNSLILSDGVNDIPPGEEEDFLGGMEAKRRNNCAATTNPTGNDDSLLGYTPCSRWTNITTGEGWILVREPSPGNADWRRITGVIGNEFSITLDFDYTTASPADFGIVRISDLIIRSEIEVTTPFDDPAATLRLQLGTGEIIIQQAEVDPGAVGNYGNDDNLKAASQTTGRLVISPGISTQGAGRVVLSIRSA